MLNIVAIKQVLDQKKKKNLIMSHFSALIQMKAPWNLQNVSKKKKKEILNTHFSSFYFFKHEAYKYDKPLILVQNLSLF